MKNLARLILALIATQLFVAGFARAVTTSTVVDQKSHVSALPSGEDPPDENF
jgi:hypothetical protein